MAVYTQFRRRSMFNKDNALTPCKSYPKDCLKDWNRGIRSGDYSINGKSIIGILGIELQDGAQGPFNNFVDLFQFLKDNLFSKANMNQKNALDLMKYMHHGGLQNALGAIIADNICNESMRSSTIITPTSSYKIDFSSCDNESGIFIHEQNIYSDIHIGQEIVNKADGDYVAKAECRTFVSYNNDFQEKPDIKVTGLVIDIKDERVKNIFDDRNIFVRLKDYIKALLDKNIMPEFPPENYANQDNSNLFEPAKKRKKPR